MKKNIHPKYKQINVICSCGNKLKINSTLDRDINLEVCNLCHPFYTGKQRTIDTGSRVSIFNKKFKIPSNNLK